MLSQNAVHCAFSGFTNFTSAFVDNKPVMIPVEYITTFGKNNRCRNRFRIPISTSFYRTSII
jgi:hypothetical protein